MTKYMVSSQYEIHQTSVFMSGIRHKEIILRKLIDVLQKGHQQEAVMAVISRDNCSNRSPLTTSRLWGRKVYRLPSEIRTITIFNSTKQILLENPQRNFYVAEKNNQS